MTAFAGKAAQQRLASRLERLEARLSPYERAAFSNLLPASLSRLAFLFAAPNEILSREEQQVFARLQKQEGDSVEFCALRPQTVLVMKATRLCNLRCVYCHSWKEGPNQKMTFEVLARATRDVLQQPEVRRVNFVWHGGEVTLLPIEFFEKALWIQQVFRREGQTLSNSIQTNATRLTEDWVSLFRAGNFQVGVSVDGPREVHDLRRKTKNGAPSWEKVQSGIAHLREGGVSWGALVVVDNEVIALGAKRLLDSLLQLGVTHAALLNVIPQNIPDSPRSANYLAWPGYVNFLVETFDEWWCNYRSKIEIRELSALVNTLSGHTPKVCVLAGDCMGQFLTIEPDGIVTACDKYIGDRRFVFGSLLDSDLNTLIARSTNLRRARGETQIELTHLSDCQYFVRCQGGCPHDRLLNRTYNPTWDGRCCGLAKLLKHIEASLH